MYVELLVSNVRFVIAAWNFDMLGVVAKRTDGYKLFELLKHTQSRHRTIVYKGVPVLVLEIIIAVYSHWL